MPCLHSLSLSYFSLSLVRLHGLGDDGDTWETKLRSLKSHLHGSSLIFPKATLSTVTCDITSLLRSSNSQTEKKIPSWFDIKNLPLSLNEPPPLIGLDESVLSIIALMNSEFKGLDPSRIVIGGFSQGGALALEVMSRLSHLKLGGVVCVSAWFVKEYVAAAEVACTYRPTSPKIEKFDTPVLFTYGTKDPVISLELSKRSCELLSHRNNAEIYEVHRSSHMPKLTETDKVISFIKQCYSNSNDADIDNSDVDRSGNGDDVYRSRLECLRDIPHTLPTSLRNESGLKYNTTEYPIYEATRSLLQRLKVGYFKSNTEKKLSLELFEVRQAFIIVSCILTCICINIFYFVAFQMQSSMNNFKNRFEFYKTVARDEVFLTQYDELVREPPLSSNCHSYLIIHA